MKVTSWYSMDVLPVRDGVYEVWCLTFACFARFYCGQWRITSYTIKSAAKQELHSRDCYDGRATGWRGLAAQRGKP